MATLRVVPGTMRHTTIAWQAQIMYSEHFQESSQVTGSKLQSALYLIESVRESPTPMKRSQNDPVPGFAVGPPCALSGIKNLFKYSLYNVHYGPSVLDDPGSELTVADSCNIGYRRD